MQVNRNTSIVLAERPAAPHEPATQTSLNSPQENRRAVKNIASSIDSDLRKLNRQGRFTNNTRSCREIRNSVHANQLRLRVLLENDLDRNPPPQTVMRKARSTVLLTSSMVGRGCAIAGASVVGIVEGSAIAVTIPPACALVGMQKGVRWGTNLFGGYLAPITAPVFGVLGAGVSTVNGVVSAVNLIPVKVTSRGSFMRSTFNILDPYSKAAAHVARKSMSTQEIADAAASEAFRAQLKIEKHLDEEIYQINVS